MIYLMEGNNKCISVIQKSMRMPLIILISLMLGIHLFPDIPTINTYSRMDAV